MNQRFQATGLVVYSMIAITGCGNHPEEALESANEIAKAQSLGTIILDELKEYRERHGVYPPKLSDIPLPDDHDFYSLGGTAADLESFAYAIDTDSCQLSWENDEYEFGFALDSDGKVHAIAVSTTH